MDKIKELREADPCIIPPEGWYCTRGDGHSGPCAAIPIEPPFEGELSADDHAKIDAAWEKHKAAGPPGDAELRVEIQRALIATLGDVYDCTRVWSAWSYGTMSEDDFVTVVDRMDELIDEIVAGVVRSILNSPDEAGVERAATLPEMVMLRELYSQGLDEEAAGETVGGLSDALAREGWSIVRTPTDQPATGDGAEDVVERLMDEAYQSADCPAGGPYALSWEQAKYMVRAAFTSTAVVPGMVERDAKAIAAAVVQSACETDPADPDHPETILISVEDLESHVRMHVELADERAMIAAVPTPEGE